MSDGEYCTHDVDELHAFYNAMLKKEKEHPENRDNLDRILRHVEPEEVILLSEC